MLKWYSVNARTIKFEIYAFGIRLACKIPWNHCASVFISIENKVGLALDAAKEFHETSLITWLRKYKVIEICDMGETYNLSQETIREKYNIARSLLGTPYGKPSIVAIVLKYLTGKVWPGGVDGTDKVICSEAEIILAEDIIEAQGIVIEKPYDLITPRQRNKYHKMVKYNGEFENYR